MVLARGEADVRVVPQSAGSPLNALRAIVIAVAPDAEERARILRNFDGTPTLLVSRAEDAVALLECAFSGPPTPPPDATAEGVGLRIDSHARLARFADHRVALSPLEHDLLVSLHDDVGHIRSFDWLQQHVWGNDHLGNRSHVQSLVKRLRRKLLRLGCPLEIEAVRGVGLRLVPTRADSSPRRRSLSAVDHIELARAESERGELVLRERREPSGSTILELRANGIFVMDSAEFASEQALASAALELVAEPRDVLVGGLGLGFTVHQVLADPRVERCAVVEIEEALVGWMRDGTIPHGQTVLADQRVRTVIADVSVAVAEARDASYDLVLLDVDNGPHHLVHEANATIYGSGFLEDVRRLLRPGGALAIWSMDEAPDLQEVLGMVFETVDVVRRPVRLQERDEDYWLLVGRRDATP